MKTYFKLIILLSFFPCNLAFSQSSIDLKSIMLKPKDVALKKLKDWNIQIEPSKDNPDYFYGFGTGFQIELINGKVNTIWIYYNMEGKNQYPYQVDQYITPLVEISKIIEVYGKPDEKGDATKAEEDYANGWVKWRLKELQLHCTVVKGKVIMVTLMEPNWYPGK